MTLPETHVGRSILRVEDLPLIMGNGAFGGDIDRPGQLYARVVRSDVAFGNLKGVDARAALARPGVVRVITGSDIPDVRVQIRLFSGPEAEQVLQAPLTSDMVRYVGDPVAVVVAEDPYVAEDAADEVILDIEPLQAIVDMTEAAKDGAVAIHPSLGKNVVDGESVKHGEDVDELFAGAAVVVRERLTVQRHGAVPMEPRALVAEYEPEGDRMSVWGAAKVKHYNRKALAAMLEMEEESIRLVEGDVGGGFGARGEFYPEDFLIPWLARELERPVKWVEDRREGLIALNHSRESVWDVEMAADAEGTLLGYRGHTWFGQGGYVRTHGSLLLPRVMTSHFPGPFKWRGFEHQAASVLTNKTPAGTYRGPGMVEANFVRERMIDLLAAQLGIDPSEMRQRNFIQPEDFPYSVGVPDIESREPRELVEGDFPLTYERMIERAGYEQLRVEAAQRRARGELVGVGVSTFIEMPNQGPFERARLSVGTDGIFTAHVGVASVGQGVGTVLAQLTADLLGVPIDQVDINYHDTDLMPVGLGAFASRATVLGGYALAGATRELAAEARRLAAERLGVDPESIEVRGGVAYIEERKQETEIPLGELGELAVEFTYEPDETPHALFGANLVMVELDPKTGGIKIPRFVISYEVGKAMNPQLLDGQIVGAAAQGIGGAILEDFAYSADGQPLATSFMDYALPTAVEIPEIEVEVVELAATSDVDPLSGAKGAGEGGICATAAAIANGVADALGDRGREITSLPITPELVQRLAAARS